jgi:ATP-dependent helicase/nuclease subunit B
MEHSPNGGSQAAIFFDAVAHSILARHAPPDLRGATMLLPNYHAAQPLAQALARQHSGPALLLPRMTTLDDWAREIPEASPIIPDSRRNALLYRHLHKHPWFAQADLWSMTQELLALFDELTQALDALPRDAQDFTQAVQQAYQARQNETLQLEARLVFELWHAMQSGAELDEARARQQRLAQLAEQADSPLYVLRASAWSALEQRFLNEYAGRAEVEVFDLREMGQGDFLSAAFSMPLSPALSRQRERESSGAPLMELPAIRLGCQKTAAKSLVVPLAGEGEGERAGERVSSLRTQAATLQAENTPPLGNKLRFFAAASLEQEARAAAMQVRRWLQEGKREIAVVVQDREVARRMRALLERAEILVCDEAGWTFATLSVSTVLDRWLTALQSGFYHHDLLDLLKSPFIFSGMPPETRKGAVYHLEQLLRKQGVSGGLENFIQLAEHEPVLHEPLGRLRQAAAQLDQHKRRTLSAWLDALRESLAVLDIDAGLRKDDAGAQLLHALDAWREELAGDEGRYRFGEWRRWLAQQLDTKTYLDTGVESPVRFTHLAGARWRAFDAVLLLGCDADHLPRAADGGRWFNDAVRGSLGLPTRAMEAARQRDDLHALLTLNGCVLATWQKDKDGEKRLLSPFLEMLRDLHMLAYEDDLADDQLQHFLAMEEAHDAEVPQSSRPAPAVAQELIADTVSISAYNSLVACPYQFHARHLLRLNELDEVQEGIEKRDYGEHVHDILHRFHKRYPQVSGHPVQEMEAALRSISEEVFAKLLARDFSARAWLARWYKALPGYLEWQLKNEEQGWRYTEAESAFAVELDNVRLRGRIDRMDVKAGEKRVLDYKTQSAQRLTAMLREPGEDVQLACYAFAHGATAAAFVSLDGETPKSIAPPHDLAQLAELNAARLEQVMGRMRNGAGLPANGVDAVCQHCEMRGLCRKGEWVSA